MTRRRQMPDAQASDREWGEHWRREQYREYALSEKAAKDAAGWYEMTRSRERHARWLTRRPEYWGDPDFGTPAQAEAAARSLRHIADMDLRRAFNAMETARRYAGYAREAEQRWADLLARVAAYEAEQAERGEDNASTQAR